MFEITFKDEKPMQYKRYETPWKRVYRGLGEGLPEEALTLSAEKLAEVEADLNETEKHNREVRRHNNVLMADVKEQLEKMCKEMGVNYQGSRGGTLAFFKNFLKEIENATVPRSEPCKPRYNGFIIDGEYHRSNRSPVTLSALATMAVNYKEQKKKRDEKSNAALRKAIQILVEKGIDVPDDNTKTVNLVDEILRKEFVENEFAKGDIIDAPCDECGEWEIGSHRCNCGNRRISLTVDGNIIDGYYGYAEAY